jgi:hypothetical protein
MTMISFELFRMHQDIGINYTAKEMFSARARMWLF